MRKRSSTRICAVKILMGAFVFRDAMTINSQKRLERSMENCQEDQTSFSSPLPILLSAIAILSIHPYTHQYAGFA